MVFVFKKVWEFLWIYLLQHVTTNLQLSRDMQKLNTHTGFVFKKVWEFLLISPLALVTSNLQLSKDMLMPS